MGITEQKLTEWGTHLTRFLFILRYNICVPIHLNTYDVSQKQKNYTFNSTLTSMG